MPKARPSIIVVVIAIFPELCSVRAGGTGGPVFDRACKRLSKELSMRETTGDILWERRRRQILRRSQKVKNGANDTDPDVITDEYLNELRGCIELGFGFKEGQGQRLCSTLPALDLYFAINRQLSPSPDSTPHSFGSSSTPSVADSSSSLASPNSDSDSWKIASPAGDNPQLVKTRLRHWAQAVACSVSQAL
ncbi:hypothetical protein MLD38_020623 [Melastoma candidum]|uniref:Uncharacterized protein n=1 Tax=Melastoma candidum TaxID=119954 RepID=A0ACB9QHB3_9MYRT|nr:hypothetical protein MLD38_020623 [Melastoma candidum]